MKDGPEPAADAKPVDISIVIPLLDERESLRPLSQKIQATMEADGRPYEIIFVDDGSTDGSDRVLADLHESDAAVKVIQFRRNFGKSAAYSAAFERAAGRYVVTMDADLQDEPAEIPGLIAKIEEGYDLVSGWKRNGRTLWRKSCHPGFSTGPRDFSMASPSTISTAA